MKLNSKEALERLYSDIINLNEIEEDFENIRNDYIIVKQDLERLEKLAKENKVLREKVNHFKNVKNRYRRNEKFVEKENSKLKNAIEILKEHFFIDLIERVNDGKLAFVPKTPIENQPTFSRLIQEEYELLKEVLENGKK